MDKRNGWSRRGVLGAAAGLPAIAAITPAAQAQTAWTLPPERPVRVEESIWITMADGVRLSARLWRPDGPQEPPAPVVLEYIPYRKRDSYRFHDDIWGQALASRGIAYARVDVRGTGDSGGVMLDEYSEAELTDGLACIAWLAAQPWSNGAVGMRGISWGGINTLQIAARRPPALKAIMPMACCDNRFTDDAHFIGGALGHTNFQWGAQFKAVMAGPPDPAIAGPNWADAWRARLQAAPSILQTWLSHQRFDAYWRRGSVAIDYGAITVPTYLVSGWQDTYCKPVLRLFEKLSVPRKCVIGPWGHTYPWLAQPQAIDWAGEEVRWWAHWLRGADTGIMDGPALHVFMNEAPPAQLLPDPVPGRWRAIPAWPEARAPRRLYLDADRGLTADPGRARRATHPGGRVVGLAKPEWLDRPPVEQSRDDARSLVFDTAPLAHDLECLGQPKLRVRVRSSRSVAQLAARLTEVTPDGASWLVSYGLLNLTHRDGHDTPAALTPGRAYDIVIDLFPIAHRFRRGHRIRLALSDGLWPLAWPAPKPADLTFTLGRACQLELPEHAQAAGAAPPFGIAEILTPAAGDGPRPQAVLDPVAPGRYVIENNSPLVERAIRDTGAVIARGSSETSALDDGAPNTCRWTQNVVATWKGPGWDCAVEAGYALTADESAFHLVETLIARHDGATIFERRTIADVARDLL